MTFHVGQKVACLIEASDATRKKFPEAVWPSKNAVYTIRSMFPYMGRTLLRFCELDNSQSTWGGVERGFNSKYFRPIVERKTDISIFTAMLNPSKQGVDA
jgi:hypothetical protein